MTENDVVDQLAQVSSRLGERHPEMTRQVIDSVVAECHEPFAKAKVRDFVAVLVEREAKARLNAQGRPA